MNRLERYFQDYEDIAECPPHKWEECAASHSSASVMRTRLTAYEPTFDERTSRETENRRREDAEGYRKKLAEEKKQNK